MKFSFKNIPVEVRWALFDDADRTVTKSGLAASGDSVVEVDVPNEFAKPFVNVRCAGGYVIRPDQRRALIGPSETIEVDGSMFYLDDRMAESYELNHEATKSLITARHLSGRARFFAALVALETHLEYLTFAMLVLSGHLSMRKFKDLKTQKRRIAAAFDPSNTAFFDDPVSMPGNRTIEMGAISIANRDLMRVIFDEVRTLRNNVVHAWTYRHPERADIAMRFQSMGQQLLTNHEADDEFFDHATDILVSVFTRVNLLDSRASLFRERRIVEDERQVRGYG